MFIIISFVGSKWKSFSYLAVQYDKENGFTTWLHLLRKEISNVSSEISTLFNDVISKMTDAQWKEIWKDENGWDNFIAKNKIADENFKEFLGTVGDAKFDLQDYQQWLIQGGKTTSTFTSFTKKAGTALKSFGAAIASMAVNWAIGQIIGAASTAISNYIHRVEKANEAMKTAVSEYDSAKLSLESINSELDEQNKQIDELLSKDKLTYAEQGQLEELQAITKELMLQQDIAERNAERAAKEAAEKTVDAYKKQYGQYDISKEVLNGKITNVEETGIFPLSDGENDVVGNVAAYVRATELLEEARANYANALKNGEDTTSFANDVQFYIDLVDDYSDALDNSISDLQEKRLTLEEEYNKVVEKREKGIDPLTSSEQDVITTYESIYDAMKLVYEYSNQNAWNDMEISNIFNTAGIEKTKDELVAMAKAGELSPETIASYKKLNEAIQNSELFLKKGQTAAQAFCDQISAMNGALNYDKIRTQFMESVGIRGGKIRSKKENDTWENVQKELSEFDEEIVLDAYLRVCDQYGKHPEGWSAKEWVSKIQSEINKAEKIEVDTTQTLFNQLTTSKESLDKFQSSVKSAADAYSTLLSGNYSSSELLDSIQAINQSVSDMGGSLNWNFIGRQTNQLELLGDAIDYISEKYAKSILSDMGIETDSKFGQMLANSIIQAQRLSAEFDALNGNFDRLQSSYQSLYSSIEDYNETGQLTLDQLQTLISADEDWISMLEVENGKLAINQAAYEELVATQLLEFKAKLNDAAAAEIETLAKNKAEEATNSNAQASQNAVEKLDAETEAFGRNTSAAIANAIAKAEDVGVSEDEIQGVLDKYTEVWNSAIKGFDVDFPRFMGVSSAKKAGKNAGKSYKDALKDELSDLGDVISYVNNIIGDQIDLFNDQKDAAVDALEAEKDAAKEALEAEKALVQEKIDAKQAEIDKIQEVKIERKNDMDLQKAQYELERMQNQRTALVNYMPDTIVI